MTRSLSARASVTSKLDSAISKVATVARRWTCKVITRRQTVDLPGSHRRQTVDAIVDVFHRLAADGYESFGIERRGEILFASLAGCLSGLLKTSGAANDRQFERCVRQIDGQYGARLGLQRELGIAGKDHQADLLAGWDNLVIGL